MADQPGKNDETFSDTDVFILDDGGSAGAPAATPEQPQRKATGEPPAWVTYAAAGLNMFTGCAAFAVGKQLFNPANLGMQAPQEAEGLPSWYSGRYTSGRMAQAALRNVMKDTAVLMSASTVWYGLAAALRSARGADDAINTTIAGAAASSIVGAFFFDSLRTTRVAVFAVVGAALGHWGFKQREMLEARLLSKQQQLEQKHLGVARGALHQQLDMALLKRLLRLEEAEQRDQLKKAVEAHKGLGGGGSTDNGEWGSILRAAPWLLQQEGDAAAAADAAGSALDADDSDGRAPQPPVHR